MSNMLYNFGLEKFAQDTDALEQLVGHIVREGRCLPTYYGQPYFYKTLGDIDFCVRTSVKKDGNLEVTEFDTHCSNCCVWEMVNKGFKLSPESSSGLIRTEVFSGREENSGLVPIEIITADVLPSFMKGDLVTLQMTALPLEINYYADKEDYEESNAVSYDGKKWLMPVGSLVPLCLLNNHSKKNYEQGKVYENDKYVHFAAKVKRITNGAFEMFGQSENTFLRCLVDTPYGELEFVHTVDQIPEENRKNIRKGAVISGVCILSGDAAIFEYEEGITKNFHNNLRLIRYSMTHGDPHRLKSILADDAIYESDTTGDRIVGAEKIIEKFISVQKRRTQKYTAYLAEIIETDDEETEYPVGCCIVLSPSGAEGDYESIVFINESAEDKVTRIKISRDSKYHFRLIERE